MRAVYESSLAGALTELTDQLELVYSGESLGVQTGLPDLDALVPGLVPGALYVLGARPAMGKTALALNIAAQVSIKQHAPTLFFSLEMSQLELANRMVCGEAAVDSKHLRAGNLSVLDWTKVAHGFARMCDAPLWVEDNSAITQPQMLAKAKELKASVGELGLIVVDYLQLMGGKQSGERQQDVSELSRGFKLMARELEVPVLLLSQLNRGVELRVDKRPMSADLRESGAIEQDADVIMFIYRDEVYNPDSEDKGTAEILVAKQRNGPTGAVRVGYDGPTTRFSHLGKSKKKAPVVSGGKTK